MSRKGKGVLAPVVIALLLYSGKALAVPMAFRLTGEEPIKGFVDNVISVLTYDGQHLWAGTGGGVTRSIGDPTLLENWITYTRDHGLCGVSISAIAVGSDRQVWVASVGDTTIGQEDLLYGTGLSYSSPPYEEFTCIGQPGETPMQNVTYDIAINGDTIWTASWGGGLRRCTGGCMDDKDNFQKIILDYSPIDPSDPRGHVSFSVIALDSWVWVGTAGGIYMSSDAGSTWANYDHDDDGISGDFVVSLAAQYLGDDFIIWAGTKPTEPGQVDAISMSADTGKTWQTFLVGYVGEGTWNFDFQDTTVWAATSAGLFKSTDLGQHWSQYTAGNGLPSSEVYSVAVIDSMVWGGTLDGLAFTLDGGENWNFFRFSPPTSFLDAVKTYAYPNPFSPSREELGVKIRYSLQADAVVTIKVYDWALDLVKTMHLGRVTPEEGGQELLEFWDGRNENGDVVANGVYFYQIETDKGTKAFGKIVVLD